MRDRYRKLGVAGSLRVQESLLRVLRGRAPQQDVTRELVSRTLEKDDSFTLHRQVQRRFPRRWVVVGRAYDHWQVDLVDVSTYREDNGGVRYLLCCLDAFTRYAWVRTLRSKRTKEVAEQFQDVVNESPETPLFLQTDKGREFLGKAFTEILKAEGIRHFTCENDDVKCSMVERFQKTLQESAHRFFTARNTRNFLYVLQRLVASYNATHHGSLGMSPRQALETDPEEVWYNLYKKKAASQTQEETVSGDAVRISKTKGHMPDKGYKGGTRHYLFHWLGYPSSFDSWTSELVPKAKSRRKPWAGDLVVASHVHEVRWCSPVRSWWSELCCWPAYWTCPGAVVTATMTPCVPPCWVVALDSAHWDLWWTGCGLRRGSSSCSSKSRTMSSPPIWAWDITQRTQGHGTRWSWRPHCIWRVPTKWLWGDFITGGVGIV